MVIGSDLDSHFIQLPSQGKSALASPTASQPVMLELPGLGTHQHLGKGPPLAQTFPSSQCPELLQSQCPGWQLHALDKHQQNVTITATL